MGSLGVDLDGRERREPNTEKQGRTVVWKETKRTGSQETGRNRGERVALEARE